MANNTDYTYFSPEADAALKQWMGVDTWDSGDPDDEARFYQFVRALYVLDYRENGGDEDGRDLPDIEETLIRAAKDFCPTSLWSRWEKAIERFANKAETILAYEWANAL